MSFVLELQGMNIRSTNTAGPATIPTSWASIALCGSSLSLSLCVVPEND